MLDDRVSRVLYTIQCSAFAIKMTWLLAKRAGNTTERASKSLFDYSAELIKLINDISKFSAPTIAFLAF